MNNILNKDILNIIIHLGKIISFVGTILCGLLYITEHSSIVISIIAFIFILSCLDIKINNKINNINIKDTNTSNNTKQDIKYYEEINDENDEIEL